MKRHRTKTKQKPPATKTAPTEKRASALTPGPCYFDGSQDDVMVGQCDGVPGARDYCFGCKQWICSAHRKNVTASGSHDPYAHFEEET
jgi:hypothetical protein